MKQLFTLSIYLVGVLAARAQAPALTSQQPVRNASAAPRSGPLTLTFSQAITAASAAGLRPGTLGGAARPRWSSLPPKASRRASG